MTRAPGVVLGVLLLAACGSSGTPEGMPSPAASASATSTPTAPSRTSAPPTSRPVTSSGVPSTAATGTAATTSRPATTAPPATGEVTRLTPAGTHAQRVSGTVRTSLGEDDVDPDGELSVGSPSGPTQTVRLTNSALDYDLTQTLGDDGLRVSRLHLRSALFDVTFAPSDETLLPAHPRTGDTWTWSAPSTDGSSTLTFSARYDGTRTVDVAGRRVATHRVVVRLRSTGSLTFDSTSEQDLSTRTLLPVSQHTRSTGSYNGVGFATDITAILRDASGT